MAKKFIIVGQQLIAASAIDFHFQLIPSKYTNEDVLGGGWWEWDRERSEVTFFGLSSDFGPVTKEQLIDVLKHGSISIRYWWEGTTFYHTPFRYGNKIENPDVLFHREKIFER